MRTRIPNPDLAQAEARLPRWMAVSAAVVFLAALVAGHARFAAGFALGAAVAILGYTWLHQAVAVALNAGERGQRVPGTMVAKLVVRYPLAFGAVYFFYRTGWLPFDGVLVGLFVPVAGALLECLFQVGQAFREGQGPAVEGRHSMHL
jgi:ATP synthase I chain